MTPVHESYLRIVVEGAAAHRNIEDKRHVLDNVKAFTESGIYNSLSTPTERGEIEPGTAQQRDRKLFTLKNRLCRRTVVFFRALHKGIRQRIILVDNHHTGLENTGFWVGGGRVYQPLHIVGEHHVVRAHNGYEIVLYEGQTLTIVGVCAQVRFIAHIGDALIVQRGKPAGNRLVRVAVIHYNQAPVGVGLPHNREHSLFHH